VNKFIALVIAAALSSAVNAREIKVDLGRFPGRNCILSEKAPNSSNSSQTYSPRMIRVTGKVLLETSNERDESIVRICAKQAGAELGDSFSPSNTEQFEMLFEKYIDRCAQNQNPNIRIIRAFIDQKESCRDNFSPNVPNAEFERPP
jgi:hypothetical protein